MHCIVSYIVQYTHYFIHIGGVPMDAQLKKGLLDSCVLAVLSQNESYGYKIITDVAQYIDVSESTLYPILKRLEASGCLSTRTQQCGGRLRLYYSITVQGRVKLGEYVASIPTVDRLNAFVTTQYNNSK